MVSDLTLVGRRHLGGPESGAAEAADHGTHPPSGPIQRNPC